MNREIESNELKDVIGRLIARADNAYCDYISTQRTDECLGWEVKVKNNKFGINFVKTMSLSESVDLQTRTSNA